MFKCVQKLFVITRLRFLGGVLPNDLELGNYSYVVFEVTILPFPYFYLRTSYVKNRKQKKQQTKKEELNRRIAISISFLTWLLLLLKIHFTHVILFSLNYRRGWCPCALKRRNKILSCVLLFNTRRTDGLQTLISAAQDNK